MSHSRFKPIIAIASAYDSTERNIQLKSLLEEICDNHSELLDNYNFVVGGSTFERTFNKTGEFAVNTSTRDLFKDHLLKLPKFVNGGYTVLSFLISQNQISTLWDFVHPFSNFSNSPEQKTLMRLCDIWNIKKITNSASIRRWIKDEALEFDLVRNPTSFPPELILRKDKHQHDSVHINLDKSNEFPFVVIPSKKIENNSFHEWTLSIVITESMKEQFGDFVRNHEKELREFNLIITTRETGNIIIENAPQLANHIYSYHAGIEGGFTEIAMEILSGNCQALFVYSDPRESQNYIDDLLVLIRTAMLNEDVSLFTNIEHFTEWMDHVVRTTTRTNRIKI